VDSIELRPSGEFDSLETLHDQNLHAGAVAIWVCGFVTSDDVLFSGSDQLSKD